MNELIGRIEKIARHDGGRYGLKVDGVWVNGFDLPEGILESQPVKVVYDEKSNPNGGNPYRNITTLEPQGAPATPAGDGVLAATQLFNSVIAAYQGVVKPSPPMSPDDWLNVRTIFISVKDRR